MRHTDFTALTASDTPRHAIYFDWPLHIRAGGPPGYLANLAAGLEQLGRADAVDLLTREQEPAGAPAPGALFERVVCDPGAASRQAAERLEREAAFLARPDLMQVDARHLPRLRPQDRTLIHVHTTIDAVKMHNTLTCLGHRHRVKLVLTSHCPEAPAREWAEKAYAEGAPAPACELYYHNHLELDLHAFQLADVLVFPCPEAMEPYRATLPGFDALFGQRDVRFLPTGVTALPPAGDRAALRAGFGLGDGFTACYLGRHNRVKGYDLLTRAGLAMLEADPSSRVLVGGREGPLPTPDHPRWIEAGWTDRPQDLLAASDVFILPNEQTYFDLMLLEVLSAGLPVLAARTGGNRHFEGLSRGIRLFDHEADLTAALDELRATPATDRAHLGEQNRALHAARFSSSAFAARYLDLLDEIADHYRLPPAAPRARPARAADLPRLRNGEAPKVSVIVPVYNVEPFLETCLQSIRDQSLDDLEVLVINDGSTDASPEIIDRFTAADPRFLRIDQRNHGLSAARNTGLDRARGRWISFVDSDDCLDADMLARLAAAAEAGGCDMALCGVADIDANGTVVAETSGFLDNPPVYSRLHDGLLEITPEVAASMYPSAWNKLYAAHLFDRVRYDTGLHFEDHPVYYKTVLQQPRVAYVADPLYRHRSHDAGRITRSAGRRALEIFTVFDLIESILRAHCADLAQCRRQAGRILLRLVWERSFVLTEPYLRFKLSEQAMMRFAKWSLGAHDLLELRDPGISETFVHELFDNAGRFGGWDSPHKVQVEPADRVRVADRTPDAEQTRYPMVDCAPEAGFVLIHPQADRLTTAEITGLGFFGGGRVQLSLALESAQSTGAEVRAFLAPVSLLDGDALGRSHDRCWYAGTDWLSLTPGQPVPVELAVDSGSPTMALYIQSRVPEGGSMHFGWVRARCIRAIPDDPSYAPD
ncbi:glycosyltransferase [Rhodobacteraceae bacterium 2CG4]|uniref:Glycosyltransferase n=1 Tax=Halovulum marinum TaxID=2662447 RepID=A0A6L5YWY5_9RHOB|nr:glycosyltransferase [Halovulum marinum]MSU88728.1 glycosyltransferase [Halovulum marinum]